MGEPQTNHKPISSPKERAIERPTGLSVIAILMLLTVAGIVLYWALFLTHLEAQRTVYLASRSEAWIAWELSFPLPDAWIAATATLSAVGLWRMRPTGLLFSLVSGGAMVFLGLIDGLFFLENGLCIPLRPVITELLIIVWMLAFGSFVIYYTWQHRHQLAIK